MKISKTDYNTRTFQSNTNFRGISIPNKKVITDNTMKIISAAFASAGIAGLALQRDVESYGNILDKELYRSGLWNVDSEVIDEAMENTPLLVDLLISSKNKKGSTRSITTESFKILMNTYSMNPELTENLLEEKDEEGNFRFSTQEINAIVQSYDICPELHELSCKKPFLVRDLLGKTFYGASDIEVISRAFDINPEYTKKLLAQRDENNNSRFNGQQLHYFMLNGGDRNEFLDELINEKIQYEKGAPVQYRFSPDEIIQINEINNVKDRRAITKKLYRNKFETVYGESVYLDSDIIVKILCSPADVAADAIYYNYHDKDLVVTLLNLRGEDITADEFLKLKGMKNKYGTLIFEKRDLNALGYEEVLKTSPKLKYSNRGFTDGEIAQIEEYSKQAPEFVSAVMDNSSYTHTVRGGLGRPCSNVFKFNADCSMSILEAGIKNPELMQKLLQKLSVTTFTTYDGSVPQEEIVRLIKTCQRYAKNTNPQVLNALLDSNLDLYGLCEALKALRKK